MTHFDDREKAEERIFVGNNDQEFKISARRDKLLGAWAADLMGLDGALRDEYISSVVVADLKEAGDEDVFAKVYADLLASKVDITEHGLRREMERFLAQARTEFQS